ncbi:GspH/FimT family pseudopilin [Pseudomonas sp. HMWF032]|uniref:GspH/FimT family protein n=1 Tax=Pseudomonas sp. HMWF032 TaxID=2056866 RepID=UPI001304EE02|nr:GspH/FimT family pseudopilin [Pseudomonas sp. HMWF032]
MHSNTQQAFSLMELLIVLILLGLMSLMALPSLTSLTLQTQEDTIRHDLHAALNNARIQAVLNRRVVEVCPFDTGNTCTHDWKNGWQSHFIGNPQTPFARHQPKQPLTLHWTGFSKTIRFNPNGTSPLSNGRFIHCRASIVSWQLVINRQGRIRVASTEENLDQQQRCTQ